MADVWTSIFTGVIALASVSSLLWTLIFKPIDEVKKSLKAEIGGVGEQLDKVDRRLRDAEETEKAILRILETSELTSAGEKVDLIRTMKPAR